MKSPEQFNPYDKKYKKVEDLPEKEKGNFENVEGGFVRKDAARELADANLSAEIAKSSKKKATTSVENQI